ncbi:MAG: hypothetical protein JWQ95_1935 [Sphaerisporangium sp.]|jgi:hypothetical protein|nr:hypothetical protein [Sphaerisporangium sp.]
MCDRQEVPATADLKGQVRHEMTRHRAEKLVSVRRLALTALVVVISCAAASAQASAGTVAMREDPWAGAVAADHGPINLNSGNGKYNKSYSAVLSPTLTHGVQVVSNTSVGGPISTLVALCKKKHRVCNISQRNWTSRW